MSLADDIFVGAALPVMLGQFGSSVALLDPNCDPADITACVGPIQTEETDGEYHAPEVLRYRQVTFAVGDYDDVRGLHLLIDDEKWLIDEVTRGSGMFHVRCSSAGRRKSTGIPGRG